MTTGVLFVCLGNICRSPLAKFVFADLVAARGVAGRFVVDSCGTGAWHVGEGADPRTVAVARKYGLATDHAARQVAVPTDFERFHWLVAMDHANKRSLLSLGAPPERVRLLRTFDPGLGRSDDAGLAVPDPYYGGEEGFEAMYRMIRSSSEGLLDHLLREPQPGR